MTLIRINKGIEYKFDDDIHTPLGMQEREENKSINSAFSLPCIPTIPPYLPLGDGTCNE